MLKNIVKLEVSIEERVYTFLCDNDAPLNHIKEALFQYQKFIGQIEDSVKAQQDQIKADQEAKSTQEAQ